MEIVAILTGAGVSAESGIPTFRDANGLWHNHSIDKVATPQGWLENPELVWKFYQERRRSMEGIKPNAAHYALADFENKLKDNGHAFYLITQNIDGLHMVAGSENVCEMHGALRNLRCEKCGYEEESDYKEDNFFPCPECGWRHLRPDVVWFEEMPHDPHIFMSVIRQCTYFASIGTSGEVYPAAGFIHDVLRDGKKVYYQNLDVLPLHLQNNGIKEFRGKATEKVPELCEELLNEII